MLICPKCFADARCVDSKIDVDNIVRYRRYTCNECNFIFHTSEKVDSTARLRLSRIRHGLEEKSI